MSFLGRAFSVSSSEDRKFWISHFIVLVGTVFGVYLAASAGLKTAIQFELIKSDRDSYYMRSALLDELSDNVENIEKWGVEYRAGNARKFMGKPEDFKLDTYVWTTMQDTPATFEIPSEILTQIRRYYRDTKIGLSKMTSRKAAADDVERMVSKSKAINASTLLLLQADIKQLKDRLIALDIPLL